MTRLSWACYKKTSYFVAPSVFIDQNVSSVTGITFSWVEEKRTNQKLLLRATIACYERQVCASCLPALYQKQVLSIACSHNLSLGGLSMDTLSLALLLYMGCSTLADMYGLERHLDQFPDLHVCRREFAHLGHVMAKYERLQTEENDPGLWRFYDRVIVTTWSFRQFWILTEKSLTHYHRFQGMGYPDDAWRCRVCLWRLKVKLDRVSPEYFKKGILPTLIPGDEDTIIYIRWRNFQEEAQVRAVPP